MYRETVSVKQLGAWLAATSPVVIQLAADCSWVDVVKSTAVAFVAVFLVWRWGKFGRWSAIPACGILILFIGQILGDSASVWMGNSYPAVPLLLLALALWSALKGGASAAMVGCVLFWAVLVIYPVVFGAALQDVRWDWVRMADSEWDTSVQVLLLLPAMAVILKKGTKVSGRVILPGVLAVIGSVLTAGLLLYAEEDGFYQMVRSIDLFGVVKNFEALVSAGATLGWFALISCTLSICGAAGEQIAGDGKWLVYVGALAVGGLMLYEMHIPDGFWSVSTAVSWVLLPILAQGLERVKKVKKSKIDT